LRSPSLPNQAANPGVPPDTRKALVACLPADGFYESLKREEPVAFYDRGNLYEYIDGQAEGFIAYNFQALVSATYQDASDYFLVVDIYDMEKPIQAFGLYSTFRAPSNEFLSIGSQGFKTAEGCMFWKGKYVVKTSGTYGDEEAMYKATVSAAKAVAEKIADDRTGLDLLALLPERGIVANSPKYTMKAVLGQGFLDNGVTAEYTVGRSTARLFACQFPSDEDASKAYGEYLKFATAHGKATRKEGDRAFEADVKYYGLTEVFVEGRYVAGGVALPKGDPAEQAALMKALRESVPASATKEKTAGK
jgi:hypothetical protein